MGACSLVDAHTWRRAPSADVVAPVGDTYGSTRGRALHGTAWKSTPLGQVIVMHIRSVPGTQYVIIPSPPFYSNVHLSLCSRLFVTSMFTFKDDDYILTSDVDIIPLLRGTDFFLPTEDCTHCINAFFSKCCPVSSVNPVAFGLNDGTVFGLSVNAMYPMHSIGMKAMHWKQIFGRFINGSTPADIANCIFVMLMLAYPGYSPVNNT